MTKNIIPLPDVTEVMGVHVDVHAVVHFQYRGGDKYYVIRFPLDQILRSEDWFIKIRNRVSLNARIRAVPKV